MRDPANRCHVRAFALSFALLCLAVACAKPYIRSTDNPGQATGLRQNDPMAPTPAERPVVALPVTTVDPQPTYPAKKPTPSAHPSSRTPSARQ